MYYCKEEGVLAVKGSPSKPLDYDQCEYCCRHEVIKHHVEDCPLLEANIIRLMREGTVSIKKGNKVSGPVVKVKPSVKQEKPKGKTSQQRRRERYEAGDLEVGLLGESTGKFDFYVLYSNPAVRAVNKATTLPPTWGNEFDDADEGGQVYMDTTMDESPVIPPTNSIRVAKAGEQLHNWIAVPIPMKRQASLG